MKNILTTGIIRCVLVSSIALIAAAPASGAIVFDTLGATPTGTNFTKGPTGFLPYAELGYVFHVPATSDFQLDSLTFSFNSSTSVLAPLEFAAFSVGNGSPQGTLLATFTGPLFPVSTLGTFTPDTPLTLAANTDVFFRFKVANPGGLYRVDSTTTAAGPSDWSFLQSYIGNDMGNWTPALNTPVMQISATAIPEPGSFALLGAAAIFLTRRRR
jgi:hypothetical protein